MYKGNVSQLLIGILILSIFTLSFTPYQQDDPTSKLLIKIDTNNDFTGTLTLTINEEVTNSTVYYFLLPFIANNFRTNNPLVEVSNKIREGMTFVFILVTPSITLPNLQIDFDIEPSYKDAKDFYIQELDRRPNFMLVRLADNNENQNTLYLRYNITNLSNSYETLAAFTDKMLYPNEIQIRFPVDRTRFSGMGDATNIEDKDNKHRGAREDYTFTAPIEFFNSTYLWINYSFRPQYLH
ncbi:hypothetical protein [Candidatus Villigracilis affinis]|uniref:hypothetical protein n=1 Tax=Candidatus Villigracilis affinis TaxID=3140682 RepID=UPI002A237310|nr:hypothetical protein [Anaerolineales bacterium]